MALLPRPRVPFIPAEPYARGLAWLDRNGYARDALLDGTEIDLAELERPLKLGVAGKLGSGQQWWSWISLRDQVRALRHLIDTDELEGPVNLVGPNPTRNDEFTSTAGRVVGRRCS